MTNNSVKIDIRKATLNDVEDLYILECEAWNNSAASPEELKRRLTLDAKSIFVATVDDKIVGSIICIETWFEKVEFKKWKQYLQLFGTKNKKNDCLYTVSASAFSYAPKGVGQFLFKSMVDECARRGLKYLAYGSRIPGYHLYSSSMSVNDYVVAVKEGHIIDPVLSLANLLKFKMGRIIVDYFEDEASHNYGVIVYKELN